MAGVIIGPAELPLAGIGPETSLGPVRSRAGVLIVH